ncbi:MAG: hypothetical protein ABF430_12820 [Acetobacter persici]
MVHDLAGFTHHGIKLGGLRNGIGGLVVGESYRGSSPGEITFTVLV